MRIKHLVSVAAMVLALMLPGLICGSLADEQTTDTVLMVRPVAFGFNAETAVNNAFQKEGAEVNIPELARKESDAYNELLEACGINVIAVEDTLEPHTPDSVFPNNWFSTHENGTLVLYPIIDSKRSV